MRIAEIMTPYVRTVSPATSAGDAWEQMKREGVHHLIVMDGSALAGVISDRDEGGARGAAVRAQANVGDLMTRTVIGVSPDTTVQRAANMMRGRTIGCLPVVSRGRLVGMVTISDLLEFVGSGHARRAQAERRGLHHRVPHRKRKSGSPAW
jgi:acetoin utilization protein AcuB